MGCLLKTKFSTSTIGNYHYTIYNTYHCLLCFLSVWYHQHNLVLCIFLLLVNPLIQFLLYINLLFPAYVGRVLLWELSNQCRIFVWLTFYLDYRFLELNHCTAYGSRMNNLKRKQEKLKLNMVGKYIKKWAVDSSEECTTRSAINCNS